MRSSLKCICVLSYVYMLLSFGNEVHAQKNVVVFDVSNIGLKSSTHEMEMSMEVESEIELELEPTVFEMEILLEINLHI